MCAPLSDYTHKSQPNFEISLTIGNVTEIVHFPNMFPLGRSLSFYSSSPILPRSRLPFLFLSVQIENTFYTITNCIAIDLSRTNARRSRLPHKFRTHQPGRQSGRQRQTVGISEPQHTPCRVKTRSALNVLTAICQSFRASHIRFGCDSSAPLPPPSICLLSLCLMRLALFDKSKSPPYIVEKERYQGITSHANILSACIKLHKIYAKKLS